MEQAITKRCYYDIDLQIGKLLYSDVFKAGERLPSEHELSERFNTNRATVREAIIMLELKGALNVRQGSGIFLVGSTGKLSQRLLISYSEIGPSELLQTRQIVESNITGFAASQISSNELQELKKIISLQENAIAAENDKFEDLDRRFHSIITETAQDRVLIKQAAELWRVVRTKNPRWKKLNCRCLHEKHLCLQWLKDHRATFPVLQQEDSKLAREASQKHLESSKNELIKIFKQDASINDFDGFFLTH